MAARTFESEFRSWYDIPDVLRFLVKEDVLEDMSWHNDVSPSFGITGVVKGTRNRSEGYHTSEVRIWVAHPLERFRESGEKRFIVTFNNDSEGYDSWEFDDLEEALEKLFAVIVENEPKLEELPKAWPDLMEESERDPKEILNSILEKYLK